MPQGVQLTRDPSHQLKTESAILRSFILTIMAKAKAHIQQCETQGTKEEENDYEEQRCRIHGRVCRLKVNVLIALEFTGTLVHKVI